MVLMSRSREKLDKVAKEIGRVKFVLMGRYAYVTIGLCK